MTASVSAKTSLFLNWSTFCGIKGKNNITMMGYYILIGGIMLISWVVQNRLKSKFAHYSKIRLENGMSGKEIAEKMLADNGITDVKVISTPGQLTDHYNPQDKTVNLSEAVYNQRNAAAAAVAAHECGHAVQHAKSYKWLTMRSTLVPFVSVASRFSQFIILAGIVLMGMQMLGIGKIVLWLGVLFFAAGTVFSFVTLPVEYDASNRALAWLKNDHVIKSNEYEGAKDALKWAARTYVVAAVSSLAMLIYWIGLARD